ncbi:MAG: SRPBCC family protein [Nocardioides sp.]|uniref:SRPBCC family protein n=1 Tax=Nocardioides sp. TaxID=35761 RepID=UPI0039E4158F
MTNRTSIEAGEDAPTITITREFDAPRELVWRASTEPELVTQWMGPREVTMTIGHWDCRTGGSWRYTAGRAGDPDFTAFYGSFHEIRPPERAVQTFTWVGAPDGVSLETMTLSELPGGRTRMVGVSVVESFEVRDMILASGMEKGVVEGYEQLDEVLAQLDR